MEPKAKLLQSPLLTPMLTLKSLIFTAPTLTEDVTSWSLLVQEKLRVKHKTNTQCVFAYGVVKIAESQTKFLRVDRGGS